MTTLELATRMADVIGCKPEDAEDYVSDDVTGKMWKRRIAKRATTVTIKWFPGRERSLCIDRDAVFYRRVSGGKERFWLQISADGFFVWRGRPTGYELSLILSTFIPDKLDPMP
jgi:hypothetical protein